MNREELIAHTKRLIQKAQSTMNAVYPEVGEFLRVYGGPKNAFLESFEQKQPWYLDNPAGAIVPILESFLDYLEAGLYAGISPERRAQLDVVSDLLDMANTLLVHS